MKNKKARRSSGQEQQISRDKDNTIYSKSNLNTREIYFKEFAEYVKLFPKEINRQELIDNFWKVFSLKHMTITKSGEVIWH